MKRKKTFSCKCNFGFTGYFCESISPNDYLLFLSTSAKYFGANSSQSNYFVLNSMGKYEDYNVVIGENSGAYRSCSVMFNGEAIIFGGNHGIPTSINSQVS